MNIILRVIAAAVSFFLALILGVALWLGYYVSGRGWLTDEWETTNGTFKVRVQHYGSFTFFKSSHFVFQVSPAGGGTWREVAAYPYDQFEISIPMPRDQVKFVNSEVGYFYMEWVGIAATRDGGKTWALWRPTNRELGVEKAVILPDGSGVATLWSYDRDLGRRIYHTAHTDDYGQHWRVEP